MSLMRCEYCQCDIDLDFDSEHFNYDSEGNIINCIVEEIDIGGY